MVSPADAGRERSGRDRAGRKVVYDAVSDAKISCIDVRGRLSFKPDANTRLKVANVMVWDEGTLEVGTPAQPVSANVSAEIIIADQPIDRKVDPAEIGNGIEALGKITMHGAEKLPTFVRLAKEPLAAQTTLTVEQAVGSWRAGDRIVIPDTRQLRDSERGDNYKPQDEELEIASVSGNRIQLISPLQYDHKGARNADGKLEFLPHLGNLSRNVIVRSENPAGTRGHMIFMSRADVDLRFVEVREMGRTRMGVLDNTEFNDQDQVVKLGDNQIGRYGIHFHHYFGPKRTPENGYQFTLIGNSVDGAPKWGITVHNSHYGLIQDNVVYNTRGAGIVTEDGTESFNVFDHNFAMRSQGSASSRPAADIAGPDPIRAAKVRASGSAVRTTISATTSPLMPMSSASRASQPACLVSFRFRSSKARTQAFGGRPWIWIPPKPRCSNSPTMKRMALSRPVSPAVGMASLKIFTSGMPRAME